MYSFAILAAALPMILWAFSDSIGRTIARLAGNLRSSILVVGLGIIPPLAAYALSGGGISTYAILLSCISGIFFAMGYLLFYKSLETEQISNAVGTGLIQPVLLVIFSIIGLGESITFGQGLGGIIIIAGVLLITTTSAGMKINRKLLPAVLANVSWSFYWVFASYAIISAGQSSLPISISRATGLAALALFFLAAKDTGRVQRISPKKSLLYLLAISLVAGAMDGAGNLIFGHFVNVNMLQVASIFTAMMPLLVIVLARFFYKEKLTRVHWIGFAIAIVGALVIGIS